MVLRAKMVALSLTVDWLSNAPWVSSINTATCNRRVTLLTLLYTTHTPTYLLFTPWQCDNEWFAPHEYSSRLSLTPSPPGEPSERFTFLSYPVIRPIKTLYNVTWPSVHYHMTRYTMSHDQSTLHDQPKVYKMTRLHISDGDFDITYSIWKKSQKIIEKKWFPFSKGACHWQNNNFLVSNIVWE